MHKESKLFTSTIYCLLYCKIIKCYSKPNFVTFNIIKDWKHFHANGILCLKWPCDIYVYLHDFWRVLFSLCWLIWANILENVSWCETHGGIWKYHRSSLLWGVYGNMPLYTVSRGEHTKKGLQTCKGFIYLWLCAILCCGGALLETDPAYWTAKSSEKDRGEACVCIR